MANFNKRVRENVPGDFFVDSTCIDCDACRQLAPAVFGEGNETSFVKHQPTTLEQRRSALHALLACPTGSIGCQSSVDLKAASGDFPLLLEEPVYYCGFNSRKSYGGNSYLIRRADGNWLIDSPKYLPQLVARIEQLGGLRTIFLTHSDDVADADKYARHFSARRVIHQLELHSQPNAEIVLRGESTTEFAPGCIAIPTPGHTAGHCCLLLDDKFLFTGDHLSWDRDEERLSASEDYCWYSWTQQGESMARLAEFRFEWVLPGHGQRIKLPAESMRAQVSNLAKRMQGSP